MVDMAHYAGLIAGGVYPSPLPHAHVVTTTTHKTLRGPRGGMILSNDEEIGKKINSAVFPGLQGGPLMHVIAAKAVSFGEALQPEFKLYAQAHAGERARAGRAADRERSGRGFRRHRQPSDAGRSAAQERHRQSRRAERSSARSSPATRTASRSIRKNRWSPPASASARPPAPRAASARGVPPGGGSDLRSAGRAAEVERRQFRDRSGGRRKGGSADGAVSDLLTVE